MSDDPKREYEMPAIVRDLIAGVALIALGVVTGTSSFIGHPDGIDYAFDTLGGFWILWAIRRAILQRLTIPGRPPA